MKDIDALFDSLKSNTTKDYSTSQYGPGNPEPGGDGTDGEDTKEIVDLLKKCRRVVQLRAEPLGKSDRRFEQGDLVYDERTEEHGVVLGEMPDIDHIAEQLTYMNSPRPSVTTRYIVLTITKCSDADTGMKTRIRYVNKNYLRKLEERIDTMSDLDIFCSKQCIHDCSDLCALYKYKRVRDKVDNE